MACSWPACPVFAANGPWARPFAGQFQKQRRQSGAAAGHFGPWQAMKCGDRPAPVPASAHKRIIRLCGTVKDGSARTNEIVNQGPAWPCAPQAAQGMPPCAPQTPPESPLQGLKGHRYPGGKREKGGFSNACTGHFECFMSCRGLGGRTQSSRPFCAGAPIRVGQGLALIQTPRPGSATAEMPAAARSDS